jgi:hypothetical protein
VDQLEAQNFGGVGVGSVNVTRGEEDVRALLKALSPAVDELRLSTLRGYDMLVEYGDIARLPAEQVHTVTVFFDKAGYVIDPSSVTDKRLASFVASLTPPPSGSS